MWTKNSVIICIDKELTSACVTVSVDIGDFYPFFFWFCFQQINNSFLLKLQIYHKISLFCFQTWNQKWNCDARLPYILEQQLRALFRSRFRMSVCDTLIPVRPICRLHPLTVFDQVRTFLWEKKKINIVESFNFKFVISFQGRWDVR